ncbi:MAG: CPBP family intramembrane metalloprotease [Negativicutes bacterium]|nr:CPBP family intramembrane metalloprotease [Negativicutes bacterium]
MKEIGKKIGSAIWGYFIILILVEGVLTWIARRWNIASLTELAYLLPQLAASLWLYRKIKQEKIVISVSNDSGFTIKRFCGFLLLLVFGNVFFSSLTATIVQNVLGRFNYNFNFDLLNNSTAVTSPARLLTVIFLAPITEELLFRGIILQKLKEFGPVFSIGMTTLLFTLVHGNIISMFGVFFPGLLFGYVALRYSISWSILLHMANNAFALFFQSLPDSHFFLQAQYFMFFLGLLALLILCLIIFKKRAAIRQFFRNDKVDRNLYWQLFASKRMIGLIVLFIMTNLLFIQASLPGIPS